MTPIIKDPAHYLQLKENLKKGISMKKFTDKILIHLADTDATGVIFFPKLFEKCIATLEKFLIENKLTSKLFLSHTGLAVIDAKAHYYKPMVVHEELKIEMGVTKVGTTSVSFSYKFFNRREELTAEADIVHVCIDLSSKSKKELPLEFIATFKTLN
jgi:1,4-dihydroxy-2-naphthoyl-CoA hydrolase